MRPFVLAGCSVGLATLTRITAILWALPLLAFVLYPDEDMRQPLKPSPVSEARNGVWRRPRSFSRRPLLVQLCPFWVRVRSWLQPVARTRNIDNFGGSLWLGLLGETVSPGKGALLYSPVLVLA
jgi:hypothetical protein